MNTPEKHDMDMLEVDDRERLIGRLVDGEAGADERAAFERLAEADPSLWRDLSRAQEHMAALRLDVASVVRVADEVDLPTAGPRRPLMIAGWALGVTGWAAALALAAVWVFTAPQAVSGERATVRQAAEVVPSMSYEELRRAYLTAPFVLDELDPIVLEVEELNDGRLAVRFMRRIEEVMFVDPEEPLFVDEEGALEQDPGVFRSRDPEKWSPEYH